MLSCLSQGDQGLPGEVGAPGERGTGEPGAKVSHSSHQLKPLTCPGTVTDP